MSAQLLQAVDAVGPSAVLVYSSALLAAVEQADNEHTGRVYAELASTLAEPLADGYRQPLVLAYAEAELASPGFGDDLIRSFHETFLADSRNVLAGALARELGGARLQWILYVMDEMMLPAMPGENETPA